MLITLTILFAFAALCFYFAQRFWRKTFEREVRKHSRTKDELEAISAINKCLWRQLHGIDEVLEAEYLIEEK